MKAVVQRVNYANLKVDGEVVSEIKKGLVVFLGVGKDDGDDSIAFMTKKIPSLRIFEDENGKINKSVMDVQGEILLVSQFTLYADCSHGNRPGFTLAESPEKANQTYIKTVESLKSVGVPVKLGVFGADMKITQENDGPFTVILEK